MTTETPIPAIERLAKFASEYTFDRTWGDGDKRTVQISRHSNHGRWVEGGGWVVCFWFGGFGSMNPWYLSSDGKWRYKYGNRFKSVEDAYAALKASESIKASLATAP